MYRKFTANNIFDGYRFLSPQKVLITKQNGVVEDIVSLKDAGDDVEFLHGIICPGFINAHCHVELSHLKNIIPQKTGLVDFVLKIITQRHFEEEKILAAIETAENEMLQNGIVAVGDICNTAYTIAQKKKQKLHYHNFIEVSGFVPALAHQRFDNAKAILSEFLSTTSNQQSTISPHAPYSVSKQLFQLINKETAGQIISIHNQETIAEEDFIKNKSGDFLKLYQQLNIDIEFYKPSGKSSLQTWLPYFNNHQSKILVHNVTTTKEAIKLTKDIRHQTSNIQHQLTINHHPSTLHFCLCPNANLYITNTLPNVKMLVENNCNIILGTDSLASNTQLNILEEIKTLQKYFPEIELAIMLQWATSNGATALQMDKKLGSFKKGKQPGVVLIEGVQNLQVNENSFSKIIL